MDRTEAGRKSWVTRKSNQRHRIKVAGGKKAAIVKKRNIARKKAEIRKSQKSGSLYESFYKIWNAMNHA